MNNIALGRYLPYNSFIHRLDPRIKLFGMISLMVLIFLKFASVAMNFVMYAVTAIIILVLLKVAHIKLRTLFRQLRMLWFMMFFLLVINIFTLKTPNDTVAFSFWFITVYWGAIIQTLYIFVRLVLMIATTMILTSTTRPLDLTYALEWYLIPFKVIKFPTHEIAMTISIALRFIPTLLDETGRIMKAQESRGVDFKDGKLKEKIRAIVSLIVPLFISAFQRSDELANAMEARGYNPQGKRTRYRKMTWKLVDTFSLVFVLVLLGSYIAIKSTNFDFIPLFTQLFQTISGWF